MKPFIAVLIAAVTLNCLVTIINGKAATDKLAEPYIDMLLPPFQDIQDNGKDDAAAKIIATAKDTPVSITTATTKKPITKNEINILPKPSIEALLPPLLETTMQKEDATTKTTTYSTTTTKPKSTTNKSSTTTATIALKPSNLKPNDLFLDSLLPPLFNASSIDAKEIKVITTTATTLKPITTTKKSFYQQQAKYTKQQDDIHAHTKNYPIQQPKFKHSQLHSAGSGVKNYNKIATANEGHVAVSQTHQKHVFLTSQLENDKTEKIIPQYVAKEAASNNNNNNKHAKKQYNYNFDSYFGSTTPRPPKSGLPTITPFPRHLGK